MRINRYIVGCKSHLLHCIFQPDLRINRYIVGCKLKILKCTFLVLAELIDTKWDVNTGVRQVKKMRSFELIDT